MTGNLGLVTVGINAAIALLEQLSDRLTVLVKLDDPFVDQLLEIKQLAWSARNVGGDVSVMISGPLAGQKISRAEQAIPTIFVTHEGEKTENIYLIGEPPANL